MAAVLKNYASFEEDAGYLRYTYDNVTGRLTTVTGKNCAGVADRQQWVDAGNMPRRDFDFGATEQTVTLPTQTANRIFVTADPDTGRLMGIYLRVWYDGPA